MTKEQLSELSELKDKVVLAREAGRMAIGTADLFGRRHPFALANVVARSAEQDVGMACYWLDKAVRVLELAAAEEGGAE